MVIIVIFIFLIVGDSMGYDTMIQTYFNQKSINMITFFDCQKQISNETLNLVKALRDEGYRTNIELIMDNGTVELFNHQRVRYFHEGFVVNILCPGATPFITLMGLIKHFTDLEYWLLIQGEVQEKVGKLSDVGVELLSSADVFVNSQVMWAQRTSCNGTCYEIFDVYRIGFHTSVTATFLGLYPNDNLVKIWKNLGPVSRRRSNLEQILLTAGYVLEFPKEFTYMDDLHTRGIDTILKRSYPMMVLLQQDLNFSTHFIETNSIGWDRNNSGTFDGLMGLLQRRDIDFGYQHCLMRHDRMAVCDYGTELIQSTARLIFRQPPLSTVSNIYVLPFDLRVWLCCLAMAGVIALIFGIQFWFLNFYDMETAGKVVNSSDMITLITGAACQQGFSISPSSLSVRLTMLVLFTSALFFFTSYSANIVALLQSPSTSIRSLEDLIASPMVVGMQNITYNKIYMKESRHELTKQLYTEKILPRGSKSYLTVADGIALVRRGMFAFQVDTGAAYDEISATFTEDQKNGLDELTLFKIPKQAVCYGKRFPYRDMFTTRLRWQREVGKMDHVAKIWVPQPPKVQSSQLSGYVNVGLTEFGPALKTFVYGCILSIVLLVIERVVDFTSKRMNRRRIFNLDYKVKTK